MCVSGGGGGGGGGCSGGKEGLRPFEEVVAREEMIRGIGDGSDLQVVTDRHSRRQLFALSW